ncbi:MAG: PHP domain-containing protein [bacterium]
MTESIRVELHCQSSMSDGDLTPAHVARILADAGVVWAALTDHNTVSGQDSFRQALQRRGVHVVTGLEIDARSPQGPMHLLAYGFDQDDQELANALRSLRHPLLSSARRLTARALALLERPSRSPEGPSPPRCVSRAPKSPDTAEAIRLVHNAGGLVFLAHPLASLRTMERLEAALDWLQPQGLDGIEAFHKPYPDETQRLLAALAAQRDLLVVAGSDFHGPHHTDGTSPGIDIPLADWRRLAESLRLGPDIARRANVSDATVLSEASRGR